MQDVFKAIVAKITNTSQTLSLRNEELTQATNEVSNRTMQELATDSEI